MANPSRKRLFYYQTYACCNNKTETSYDFRNIVICRIPCDICKSSRNADTNQPSKCIFPCLFKCNSCYPNQDCRDYCQNRCPLEFIQTVDKNKYDWRNQRIQCLS